MAGGAPPKQITRNQYSLMLGQQGNQATSQALQQSLLGYLGTGTPTNVNGVQFPGGMSLADMGFTGQVVPGADPMQTQAWQMAAGVPGSQQDLQRQWTTGSIMQGTPSFQADPAMRERYFQQAISDPAMRQYTQEMLPEIAARFGRGGNLGAAQWAGSQAGSQLAGQLAGQRAGLLRGDEVLGAASQDSAWNRALQAVPISYANQTQPIGLLGAAGDQSRGIQGQLNQQQLQEAYMAQPFGDPRLSLFGMLPGGSFSMPGQVAAPQAGGSNTGATAGLLGGLLTGPTFGGGVLGSILNPVGALLGGGGGLGIF